MMQSATLSTLHQAHRIASTYGGNLTLRQLYYRLVAGAHIPNSQQAYKRLGGIVANARLAGDFPLEWLIDRGRTVHDASSADDRVDVDYAFHESQDAIGNFPWWFIDRGRWFNQPTQISVWVEKEALSGVFQAPCERAGVGWFACKGYPSLSSLYDWLKRARTIEDACDYEVMEHRVLYFGDHDPDGWQIPRSALNTIGEIRRVMDDPPYAQIAFERVALNMAQIQVHNPPPFPAKVSSSRFRGYVDEHGTTDAWELDALDPPTLTALITSSVGAYFDEDIHDANRVLVDDQRAQLRREMQANPARLLQRLLGTP